MESTMFREWLSISCILLALGISRADSNESEVRAGLSSEGWKVAWGKRINDGEYH
jgi:hypothetical protein